MCCAQGETRYEARLVVLQMMFAVPQTVGVGDFFLTMFVLTWCSLNLTSRSVL